MENSQTQLLFLPFQLSNNCIFYLSHFLTTFKTLFCICCTHMHVCIASIVMSLLKYMCYKLIILHSSDGNPKAQGRFMDFKLVRIGFTPQLLNFGQSFFLLHCTEDKAHPFHSWGRLLSSIEADRCLHGPSEALGSIPRTAETGCDRTSLKLSTPEGKAKQLEIKGHPQLHKQVIGQSTMHETLSQK